MDQDSARENFRLVGMNLIVIAIFIILMTTFIYYFSKNEPDYKKLEMGLLADTFATTVTNAHWQWIAEGKPTRILVVQYGLDGKEVDRRPIPMSHLGWPKASIDSDGCAELWDIVLDVPLEVKRFKVYADYIDGLEETGKVLDTKCRYSLRAGPEFEYKIYTGVLTKTNV